MTNTCIHTCKALQELAINNIVRVESKSNYCKIFFADKSHPLTLSKTLGLVAQHLPTDIFLRTHRTHLINKNFIAKIFLSSLQIQLLNGEKICISRRRKLYVHKMIA
jgi:two-component system, LytTR family, response regulator